MTTLIQQLDGRVVDSPGDHLLAEFASAVDAVVEGERIYGDGVNIAARLESLAEGGGISISGTVYDQVKNQLTLSYVYQGEQTVKNIADPVGMYRVGLEAEATSSTERTAQSEALPLPDKYLIAVLPFTNMSADTEQRPGGSRAHS